MVTWSIGEHTSENQLKQQRVIYSTLSLHVIASLRGEGNVVTTQ